ncbi:hypothetical protein EYZ11_003793 [Aspergillus tanneri]|uniref:Uncharacterized protein n=1 Tax=Aspergillus tanneri TaxID=1220188 RepID=A0A4S3JML1_9EURO|nr:uncharacterized protein ATNIH1004_001685 [Aspergillus tanneri]KAA8652780.1 hypothetical protein ATNIH1004_001685 [Aspergillus tanneri]THC96735.1 hypothetical protein EYZ11_003793 [Aspergillus tanneri]
MEGLWEKQPCSTADRHIVESDSADDSNKAAGLASNTGAFKAQLAMASHASNLLTCHDATPLSPAGRQNPMGGPFPKPPGQGVPGSWTLEEDAAIIALHDRGEKWEDIGRHLQGRSGTACHFRYVFLRHRPEWNEEWKDQVAVWYQR